MGLNFLKIIDDFLDNYRAIAIEGNKEKLELFCQQNEDILSKWKLVLKMIFARMTDYFDYKNWKKHSKNYQFHTFIWMLRTLFIISEDVIIENVERILQKNTTDMNERMMKFDGNIKDVYTYHYFKEKLQEFTSLLFHKNFDNSIFRIIGEYLLNQYHIIIRYYLEEQESDLLRKIRVNNINDNGELYFVQSPARLDFTGSWSDLVPICFDEQYASHVLNVAILVNEQMPIGCFNEFIDDPSSIGNYILYHEYGLNDDDNDAIQTQISSIDDVKKLLKLKTRRKIDLEEMVQWAENDSKNKIDLIDAILSLFNFSARITKYLSVNKSRVFSISTYSALPKCSGLGTSSILCTSLIKLFSELLRIDLSRKELIRTAMIAEQYLTSGGGWQDMAAVLTPGLILRYHERKTNCPSNEMNIGELSVDKENEIYNIFNDRLYLLYTGKTRLSTNLTKQVLRKYLLYMNVEKYLGEMIRNAQNSYNSFEGKLMNYEKFCEKSNEQFKKIEEILGELSDCFSFGGAGGGGFYFGLRKEKFQKFEFEQLILDYCKEKSDMKFYSVKLSTISLKIEKIEIS
ncbi:hypothetical protein SNEBB_010964 [Seison nebaliae]|nr:hypothetical protein SNEBB_010964 [Seison nebaliae]